MPTAHETHSHLIPSRRERPGDDPIFALNHEATARKARGEDVLNATLGALLDDDGRLAVLPTAARAVREVAAADWAAYAPIAGPPAFLEAVKKDVFPGRPDLVARSAAVATPGGSGALRHAIASFLEPGRPLLTTSFYWGPYATIAEENERTLETFRTFTSAGPGAPLTLDVGALDEALGRHLRRHGRALLILNDPCHNPTGYSMSESEWAAVAGVLSRRSAEGSVAVVVDGAYAEYGPGGGLSRPLGALEPLADRVLVLVAWSASKTFTHYGLRVGALVALAPDDAERRAIQDALTFACRGTWSNCNRGGITAVTRLLTDPDLSAAVRRERSDLVGLLGRRVASFNREAAAAGLVFPRYEGGFFATVLVEDAQRAAEALQRSGVFVVPLDGGLRLGLCAVPTAQVPRLVRALVDASV